MRFGVCREERSPHQKRLRPEELEARRSANRDLLDLASEYIAEFYEFLSSERFLIAVVDADGYVLQVSGSDAITAVFRERNYAPGFRFTEKDTGTTATSLCLKLKTSVQLNDKDHFCLRAHGFTSSAAPIFGEGEVLRGALVISGKSDLVHPHTLIMVTSAARSIERQIQLIRRNREMAERLSGGNAYFTFDHLVGDSPGFLKAVGIAKRAALMNTTVLLLGETGTGKELFAQAIHNAGPLSSRPFIPINCGAIPGELMESELFGYVEGAFSGALSGGRPGKFEMARGGTILLDEIGDMPYHMQVKLLRVLQTGEVQRIGDSKIVKVDTRIIASTNTDLSQAIAQHRFRQDLYYRLNILPIQVPPLRERGAGDIHALAEYFVKKYNPRCRLTAGATAELVSYSWPGNVRELENVIQRALTVCDGRKVTPEDLNLPARRPLAAAAAGPLDEMERGMIASTLERTNFNMAISAAMLGISRATLYRKVKIYRLRPAKDPS
jgi:transcriptional regulator of acetoin/glycerol metabolism